MIKIFHDLTVIFLMSLATLGWSLSESIGKVTVKYGDALTFNTIKLASAVTTVFIILSLTNRRILAGLFDFPWMIVILACIIGLIHHMGNLIYYLSLKKIPLHIIAPIAHTDPYWTFFFAVVFLNEPFDLRILFAGLLIILGVRMLTKKSKDIDITDNKPLIISTYKTILLGLGVSLCWSLQTLLSKFCLKEGMTVLNLLILKNMGGLLTFLFLTMIRSVFCKEYVFHIKNRKFIYGSILAGLFANVLGDLMFINALNLASASRISIYCSLVLMYDLVFSKLLLKEKMRIYSIIGFILIMLAVMLVTI